MMITFTQGNLLEADAEAFVNTVNTVGVMGKGVALMFKEAFPENFKAYLAACKAKEVQLGEMFVTKRDGFLGPKWIVNFPTKAHWRYPSQMAWIENGLDDLKRFIVSEGVKSIALPPLGAGNGGLEWSDVQHVIVEKLSDLTDVEILVFVPTRKYQNVAKRTGVEKLTPARALIAELVRRYSILGIECSLLEVQKLGYFLDRFARRLSISTFDFQFVANKYGPYSDKLRHMLSGLDGSYLHCDKRLSDAGPFDIIRFDDAKRDKVAAYLTTPEAKTYRDVLDATTELIDGFESPLGMEGLATVDWLISQQGVAPEVAAVRAKIASWPGGQEAAERKLKLFDDRIVALSIEALQDSRLGGQTRVL